jgi:hypothetical protein
VSLSFSEFHLPIAFQPLNLMNDKTMIRENLTADQWIEVIRKEANEYRGRHPEVRYGQSIFTIANKYFPNWCEMITSTDDDCFYRNDLVPNFLKKLRSLL